MKKEREGLVFQTKEGYTVTIIKYDKSSRVVAEFNDSKHRVCVSMYQLRTGSIKNPYHRSVCGKGFLGVGRYKASRSIEATYWHRIWNGIINRCYSEIELLRVPSYKGCDVSEDFLNFQNFAEWADENNLRVGFDIDKDLKVSGNKTYSPETCIVVPREINRYAQKNRCGSPTVGFVKDIKTGRYIVKTSILNKTVHVGSYNSESEARIAYGNKRNEVLGDMIDKYESDMNNETIRILKEFDFKKI